ncbi:MAG TPA: serine O-acetyltransferase [Opitutaceae bacterium]|nr:serine O-acetyltransferase [Opitutaceae bacterium]HND60146.1 serine O-acetyltransferase [Opitutaceae bacterium]
MNLHPIKQALLDSYDQQGGINHLDGVNLPAQDSVQRLASDYMHLMFPGFFETSALTKKDVPGLVDRLLTGVHQQLTAEIEKCLTFARDPSPAARAQALAADALGRLPALRQIIQTDVTAAYQGDPAARSVEEIILAYPCVLSISVQRFANVLYRLGVPLLPRMLTEYGHERTGTDIHPGATIGTHFFIDHGTGVVIGETARIGNNVKLYQGVTLGAKSFETDAAGNPVKGIKRHPDIGDHVTIYAHATILGGDTVIGANSIIGSNVWIMRSVPTNSLAFYKGDHLVIRDRHSPGAGGMLGDEPLSWEI